MVSVDVIVPVYGNWELVEKCLNSLQNQTVKCSILVVDDCSPDDTASRIRQSFPDILLIQNEENLGFAKTCNKGIAVGNSEILILVNSDVIADEKMVEKLVSEFEKNPGLGSASPLLMRPNGTVDGLGICVDVTLSGFVRYAGAQTEELSFPFAPVLAAYGAVAAYRRSAIEQVGYLDENIFMYGEELDLGLRLAAAGWTCVGVLDAHGTHVGGASIGLGSSSQREKAAFGRGYLLRSYGLLSSRYWLRTLVTELIVCAADLLLSRDFAASRGRLRGWKYGRFAPIKPSLKALTFSKITFFESLKLRRKMAVS